MYQAQLDVIEFVADGDLAVLHLATGLRLTTYAASREDEFYVLCDRRLVGVDEEQRRAICEAAKPLLAEMLNRRTLLSVVTNERRLRHGVPVMAVTRT